MNRVLASLILSLIVAPTQLSAADNAPKLVVGITVDQLRSDYLYALQQLFGEEGFRRLMREGAVCDEVLYELPHLDRAVATATLYSGTIPFYNGIPAERVFDPVMRRSAPILHDSKFMGNATDDTFSAVSLRTSTLSDEVKIVGNGLGRVYSVAPDAAMAILSAGHIANSALWIDDETGRWATTTYYNDAPAYILQRNYTQSLSSRIETMKWAPQYQPEQYTAIPYSTQPLSFKYGFSPADRRCYERFKTSALVNSEVTDVAIELLEKGLLGQRGYLDMLNVSYTAATYDNGAVRQYGVELQDTYVRLDADLGRLLAAIDSKVGLENTVVFITSTGYFSGEGREPSFFKIESGEFYPKRAVSLLNMYLMALYGNGDYVLGFHHNQIFLNRDLIKERDLDIEEVRERCGAFLIDMEGVQDVYTLQRILLRSTNEHTDALRRGLSSQYSGDLFVELVPGWEVVHEDAAKRREYVRHNAVQAPFMLLAPNVAAQKITQPVDVTAIAPTVSSVLRIRSPNGCTTRAIPLERKSAEVSK